MTVLRKEDPELDAKADAIRALAATIWAAGLPVIDDAHTDAYAWGGADKTDRFIMMLQDLQPGITHVIIHATVSTPNFDQISESGVKRGGDLNAMLDPRLKEAVEKQKIILTSWRELNERRKTVK